MSTWRAAAGVIRFRSDLDDGLGRGGSPPPRGGGCGSAGRCSDPAWGDTHRSARRWQDYPRPPPPRLPAIQEAAGGACTGPEPRGGQALGRSPLPRAAPSLPFWPSARRCVAFRSTPLREPGPGGRAAARPSRVPSATAGVSQRARPRAGRGGGGGGQSCRASSACASPAGRVGERRRRCIWAVLPLICLRAGNSLIDTLIILLGIRHAAHRFLDAAVIRFGGPFVWAAVRLAIGGNVTGSPCFQKKQVVLALKCGVRW